MGTARVDFPLDHEVIWEQNDLDRRSQRLEIGVKFVRFAMTATLGFLIFAPAVAQVATEGGMHNREIKALPAVELAGLLAGRGLGLAQAAELNHYPGPTHVLELRDELSLTELQLEAVKSIFYRTASAARVIGAQLVQKERELDIAFREATITPSILGRLTAEIAVLKGQLRKAHLMAHLETRPVLTPHQIETYDRLRGYTDGPPAGSNGHADRKPG